MEEPDIRNQFTHEVSSGAAVRKSDTAGTKYQRASRSRHAALCT